MESSNSLLIAIDAGHGGYDNGASWQGRLEKNDNLRLAGAVRNQLNAQGINVLMTRKDDTFVSLQDRARMANEADADLFVSLHRNSYPEQTESANGVENFIYLTAPEASSGLAAQLVLNAVVNTGVQNNRGVKRGNYYVLRKTVMPAMLLEMGYINNDLDNQLFDERLSAYAAAIASGIMAYFGLTYNPAPQPVPTFPGPIPTTPVPTLPIGTLPEPLPPISTLPLPIPPSNLPTLPVPTCIVPTLPVGTLPQPVPTSPVSTLPELLPVDPAALISAAQSALDTRYNFGLQISGELNDATRHAVVKAMQMELNNAFNANLPVDGVYSAEMKKWLPTVTSDDRGIFVWLLQALLMLHGYNTPWIDGIFGPRTELALRTWQRDNYFQTDAVATPAVLERLLSF